MDECWDETTPDRAADTESVPLCLTDVAADRPDDSAKWVVCNDATADDSATDEDATPLARAETAAEMPADSTAESAVCSALATLASDADTEFTPLTRADTPVETPTDTLSSLLCADEMNAEFPLDTDAMRPMRSAVAADIPDASEASATCSVDATADNDADMDDTPVLRATPLDASDVEVAEIMEYSAGPASSAVAISNSVSRVEGAAPTNDVTAANTAADRFETCAFSAPEMWAAVDAIVDAPVATALDNDETPALLSLEATDRADPSWEVTLCNELTDCDAAEARDATSALRELTFAVNSD